MTCSLISAGAQALHFCSSLGGWAAPLLMSYLTVTHGTANAAFVRVFQLAGLLALPCVALLAVFVQRRTRPLGVEDARVNQTPKSSTKRCGVLNMRAGATACVACRTPGYEVVIGLLCIVMFLSNGARNTWFDFLVAYARNGSVEYHPVSTAR